MQASQIPTKVQLPFANSGSKNTIPVPSQTGGVASWTDGFPPLTMTPVASGGIPPAGQDMNGALYAISAMIWWLNAGGQLSYDSAFQTLIGGYPNGAVVTSATTAGLSWRSTTDNNVTNPDTGGAGWVALKNTTYYAVAGGTSDVITASIASAPGVLSDGLQILIRASASNTTATPSLNATLGSTVTGASTIVKGAAQPLVAGDIAGAGYPCQYEWNTSYSAWVLLNPATGVTVSSSSKIQPLATPTAASNALTIGSAATTLDFRNTSLASGPPITNVAIPVLSMTIPSGATLGTSNGAQATLVELVAYNGGTPVLCVANMAGGLNLDETTLISPTTISSGSTSSGVIYSASTVSANSPFRVIGYLNVTEATAGTWVTTPSLVQGAGGQAMAAMQSLGFGQKWQGLLSNRFANVTYYNLTNRPIMVGVGYYSTANDEFYMLVNGVQIGDGGGTDSSVNQRFGLTVIVPPYNSYSAVTAGGGTIVAWAELS
jgi:hypothetical protein